MAEETFPFPSEHLTRSQIEGYCDRTLAPDATLTVSAHMAACDACRARLASALPLARATQDMITSLSSLPDIPALPTEHLTDEMRSAYAADCLDAVEREMVEDHLAECTSCRTETAQLRAVLDLLQDIPEPAHASVTSGPVTSQPLRERIAHWLGLPILRLTFQTAGVALTAGLAVFFVTRAYMTPVRSNGASVPPLISLHDRDAKIARLNDELEKAKHNEKIAQDTLTRMQRRQSAAAMPEPQSLILTSSADSDLTIPILAGSDSEDPFPFALIAPLPGDTVRPDRVTFQWAKYRAADGHMARAYRVEWKREGDTWSQGDLVQTTRWTLKKPLQPNTRYAWKVLAYDDAGGKMEPLHAPSPRVEVWFHTTSRDDIEQIRAAREALGPLGVALAKAQLFKEAEQAFETYLVAAPDDPQAMALLRRVRKLYHDSRRPLAARLESLAQTHPRSAGVTAMRAMVEQAPSERQE